MTQRMLEWLVAAFAVHHDCSSQTTVDQALASIRRLTSALDSQRLVCAAALKRLSSQPTIDLATGIGESQRESGRTFDRLDLTATVPDIGVALAEGLVSGGHLDRLGAAIRRLDRDDRRQLLDRSDELVEVATRTTVDDFARHLREVERQIHADDGETRLAQQRKAVRLRTWNDPDDGMENWKLTMDPRTAASLRARLRAATEAMYHRGSFPADAPFDLRERESFYRGHALIGLISGEATVRRGRPEITVVQDRRVPQGAAPVVDWGTEAELPAAEFDALARAAAIHQVVLEGGRVVSAPGELDVGRQSRLATVAQRRVLRAMYATCSVPGCSVRFDECTIHHIIWWRRGGLTNLDNLIPVCWRHHSDIHTNGWIVHLGDQRVLTVEMPDGRTLRGPPNRLDDTLRRASSAAVARSGRR